MSKLHTIDTSFTVAKVSTLQCYSYSSARPASTREQIQTKAARAIAFCLHHDIDPTNFRIWKLSMLSKATVADYFNNINDIREIMTQNYKIRKLKFSEINSLTTVNAYGNRRSLIGVAKDGSFIISDNINLDPTSYKFHALEVVLGLSGYSIFKSSVQCVSAKGLDAITDIFGVLCAIQLKKDKLIHHGTGITKANTLGSSVAKIIKAMAYSDGRIYHDTYYLRYLTTYDRTCSILHESENEKFTGLFHRKHGTGNVHRGSYKYMTTRRGEHFMERVVSMFTDLVLEPSKVKFNKSDLLVDVDTMKEKLGVRDRFILLSRCVGSIDGKFHISNLINDNGKTRVYGLMSMISNPARAILMYKQYDVAAALQSIVVDQLETHGKDVKKIYPAHYSLVQDRSSFRSSIVKETGRDMTWVKQKLTSIDNGGSVHKKYLNLSPALKMYKDESYYFAMDYLACIPPEQLIKAQGLTYQADIKEQWVKADIKKGKRFEDGRKKFGVFFHAWTQTERYIRELMKPYFKVYCHDVHDAIATKENVNVELLNQEIEDAGFKYVKIEL